MVLAENQKIRITSKAENIILVEKMIEDVCDVFNISEDYYGNILVALTEAVNNAIYHGNQANPNKSIDIYFKSHPNHVSFIVKDEGAGFGYDSLPDPTSPENIEKPNGRGVFLMRNLADKVTFEDNGSKVILDFNISAN
ncbi:MAG: ATP-binding protein [Bacteroidia bacterium]|nr:ATP-binding protein [Bacteroidia bacterium]